MFVRWIEDLRFVIGLFFSVISLILLFAGIVHPSYAPIHFIYGWNINLLASLYIGLFSAVMMGLGVFGAGTQDTQRIQESVIDEGEIMSLPLFE